MNEIYTKLMDLPVSIRGFTVRDCDGDYNVILNSRLSHERQMQTYYHELQHIRSGDFDSPGSVDLIEIHAHGGD